MTAARSEAAVALADVEPDDRRLVDDVLPVLLELRPHLTAASFRAIYDEGYPQGLRYLAAYRDGRCVGVAGWRFMAKTAAAPRTLYVDDLVTSDERRSSGVGAALLAELAARAAAAGAAVLELDSGTHRGRAHRFYFREGMTVSSFHFARPLA